MKLKFEIAIACMFIVFAAALLLIGCSTNKNKYIEENKKEDIGYTEVEETENILENTIEKIEHEIEPTVETEHIIDTEQTVEAEPIEDEPIFYLSEYERSVAECMVMGESGAEPYDGQLLVAQCILNACLKDGLQPSQVRKEYGYYGWHNNPSQDAKDAVSAVFDDGYKVVEECILYFYAPRYSGGGWHETQRFVIEVGGHRFFSEW